MSMFIRAQPIHAAGSASMLVKVHLRQDPNDLQSALWQVDVRVDGGSIEGECYAFMSNFVRCTTGIMMVQGPTNT